MDDGQHLKELDGTTCCRDADGFHYPSALKDDHTWSMDSNSWRAQGGFALQGLSLLIM